MKEAAEPQEEAPQEEAPQEEAPKEESPKKESPKKESPKKPRVPRESTMAVTAQVVCMFSSYVCIYSIAIKST